MRARRFQSSEGSRAIELSNHENKKPFRSYLVAVQFAIHRPQAKQHQLQRSPLATISKTRAAKNVVARARAEAETETEVQRNSRAHIEKSANSFICPSSSTLQIVYYHKYYHRARMALAIVGTTLSRGRDKASERATGTSGERAEMGPNSILHHTSKIRRQPIDTIFDIFDLCSSEFVH